MATIKDVAKAAGVGTGTVSRALSGKGYVDSEKKKQIIKIAEQLEYDPSALLKRKNNKKVKSGLIGVVLPNSSQPFFGSFLWVNSKLRIPFVTQDSPFVNESPVL